jgi:hypothetical protein
MSRCAVVLAVALHACANHAPPVREPAQNPSAHATGELAWSETIHTACQIDVTSTGNAPSSDGLSATNRSMLVQVAKCLTTGPLKDQSVAIVGRDDGLQSASVRAYLSLLGVDPSKIKMAPRPPVPGGPRVDIVLQSDVPGGS